MIAGILIPLAVLVALAIGIPRGLERMMPETLGGLVMNGLFSAVLLTLLVSLYFFAAYLMRSTALLDLLGVEPVRTLAHFARLGLGSAIVWAPILVLAVASAPKRWKENVW